MTENSPTRRYLSGKSVERRYEKSSMTIWRWVRDSELGFPKPLKIGNSNLWDEAELDAFDAAQRAKAAA